MVKDFTKFKEEGRKLLNKSTIKDLQAYGRELGVFRPTDCKKGVLIVKILEIWTGEIEPIERNKRGAPIKNNEFPTEIPRKLEELYQRYVVGEESYKDKNEHYLPIRIKRRWEFNDSSAIRIEYEDGKQKVYRGQFYPSNEHYMLLPLNCMGEYEQFIEKEMARYYGLEEGDVVSFFGERTEKGVYATEVLTINETSVEDFKRRSAEDLIPHYPFERIRFFADGEPQDITAKYLDWVFPFGKGQRSCVFGTPKSGKSTVLCTIAQYARRYNRGLKVFVVLLDAAPENVGKYRKFFDKENFVYASYEDEPEKQIFLAEYMLARAKSYADNGKDTMLIVDSIGALARAYNETEESSGGKVLSCGLESKTVRYVKKYLGAGCCYEEGGSLTVVSALTTDTGNAVDDVLQEEVLSVANACIYLDHQLALKHTYPAIDYEKSKAEQGDLLQSVEEIQLDHFLRKQYLPKTGVERFHAVLENSETYEEFKYNLYKK